MAGRGRGGQRAAGIGAYSLSIYTSAAIPFEWYDSITRWGYHPGGNPLAGISTIAHELMTRPIDFIATEKMAPYDTLNAMTAAAALADGPVHLESAWAAAYAAMVDPRLTAAVIVRPIRRTGRYCSVLFPLPILLGSMHGETRHLGLMTGFVLFYALGLMLFGNVHPLF